MEVAGALKPFYILPFQSLGHLKRVAVFVKPNLLLMTIREISDLLSRVDCHAFGREFMILIEYDKKYTMDYHEDRLRGVRRGRIYLQIQYSSPCTKTGQEESWKGRKWYLSDHMTPDEIVKTAYAAFKAAVEHEVMEGFKVDGRILFNPHVDFEYLLEASQYEVKREEQKKCTGPIGWTRQQAMCEHEYKITPTGSKCCMYCGHTIN